jgi:thymidine kinase
MNGRLELIIGSMFSGKSTELIRRINREKSIDKKIIIINYIDDNRYSSNSVSTHDQVKVNCIKVSKLMDIPNELIKNHSSIFIDEGQFFMDLYSFIVTHVNDKHIVISGLDGDSNQKPFGQILNLVPLCDSIDKLCAYCKKCNNGTLAPFTKKLGTSKNQMDIGGSDKYIPVCRFHFNEQ